MRIQRNLLPLLLLPVLVGGCSTITNLTPTRTERNATGLYPIEVAWQSRQQSLKQKTLQPQVLIGTETYAMQRVPLVSNRWETLVPIPADKSAINYRVRFDWDYNGMPAARKDTKMSPEYKLEIISRK